MATNGFMVARCGATNHQAGVVEITILQRRGAHEVYKGQDNNSGEMLTLV